MNTESTENTTIPSASAPAAVEPSQSGTETQATESTASAAEDYSWVPEKFKKDGVPDFKLAMKSYIEAEKLLSSKQEPKKTEATTDDAQNTSSGESTEISDEVLTQKLDEAQQAGVDVDTLTTYYAENGALSDEHYADLAKKGFPKEIVDSYISGQQALADKQVETVLANSVGSKEEFEKLSAWASANLTDSELATFNKNISKGPEEAEMALNYLSTLYKSRAGVKPRLYEGIMKVEGVQGFNSRQEAMAATADPRYAVDPAYRENVMARLSNSRF